MGSKQQKPTKQNANNKGKEHEKAKPANKKIKSDKNAKPFKASTSRAFDDEAPSGDDMVCRCIPFALVETMMHLNLAQRLAVQNMGFGSLFHVSITEIPIRIATWCVEQFEPRSCSLRMANNRPSIHISEEDVRATLGIPKGSIPVSRKPKRAESAVLDAWVERIGRGKWNILTKHVQDALLSEVDGGIWFMRHFLVLVECCIFEHSSDGYVKPKILDNLLDMEKVDKMNWCGHLITALFKQHQSWRKNKRNNFCGPILFLVVTLPF